MAQTNAVFVVVGIITLKLEHGLNLGYFDGLCERVHVYFCRRSFFYPTCPQMIPQRSARGSYAHTFTITTFTLTRTARSPLDYRIQLLDYVEARKLWIHEAEISKFFFFFLFLCIAQVAFFFLNGCQFDHLTIRFNFADLQFAWLSF